MVLCAALVPAAVVYLSLREPARYQATAQVYLDRQDLASSLTGISDQTPSNDPQRTIDTQVNLARVPAAARVAIRDAGVRNMSPLDLLASSSVSGLGDSDILLFSVTDRTPSVAQRLATAYAHAFVAYREQLDTAPVRRARAELESKLEGLRRQGATQTSLYRSLQDKAEELATFQALQTSRVDVIRPADTTTQIAPRPKRNGILGGVFGLVLGLALIFAVEAVDTRVRSTSEIGTILRLPLLARIPPPPRKVRRSGRLVMRAAPGASSSEAFRFLRTNLEFAKLSHGDLRTIVLTSAMDKDGKSTTAANLAIALAHSGRRVALVDLDLRKPAIASLFRLRRAPGVTEVVSGGVDLARATARVDITTAWGALDNASVPGGGGAGRLDVLVAGQTPDDPGELVNSSRLSALLAEIRQRYDFVIVDTPPVLQVGDAVAVSAEADAILLVTKLGAARRPRLNELRRVMASVPIPKLGYVATGVRGGDSYEGTGAEYDESAAPWIAQPRGEVGSRGDG